MLAVLVLHAWKGGPGPSGGLYTLAAEATGPSLLVERLRISPWAAVALAALVAAFCGNALAGSQAAQSAKPFTAKKAKRLFNRLIKHAARRRCRSRSQHAATATARPARSATNATRPRSAALQVKELFFTGTREHRRRPSSSTPAGSASPPRAPPTSTTGPELVRDRHRHARGGAQVRRPRLLSPRATPGGRAIDVPSSTRATPPSTSTTGEDQGRRPLLVHPGGRRHGQRGHLLGRRRAGRRQPLRRQRFSHGRVSRRWALALLIVALAFGLGYGVRRLADDGGDGNAELPPTASTASA